MKKALRLSSFFAIVAGVVLIAGGAWGIAFTYQNIAQENIVTPSDAVIPSAAVRGPFTLRAQADAIRKHTLAMTGGKTYAEMPREITKVDATGKQVTVPNDARNIWVTATTLTTALNLAILTYVFSGLIVLFGLISVWTGMLFRIMARKM